MVQTMVNETETTHAEQESIEKLMPIRVEDPKYNADGTINCKIWLSEDQAQPFPVTASANDCEEHGRNLFAALENGEWGDVETCTTEDIQKAALMRLESKRMALIFEADDVIRPLSDERDADIISDADLKKWKAWIKYRKALRELDITKDEVTWPTKPD